jgi:hypothetical protein
MFTPTLIFPATNGRETAKAKILVRHAGAVGGQVVGVTFIASVSDHLPSDVLEFALGTQMEWPLLIGTGKIAMPADDKLRRGWSASR